MKAKPQGAAELEEVSNDRKLSILRMRRRGNFPAHERDEESDKQDRRDQSDAGRPFAHLPHIAWDDSACGSSEVVAADIESGGGSPGSGRRSVAQEAVGGRLGDEDSGTDQAEAGEYDDPEGMTQGDEDAGQRGADGDGDAGAHADAGDEVSASRSDDEADEVNSEEITESSGGEVKGWVGEGRR